MTRRIIALVAALAAVAGLSLTAAAPASAAVYRTTQSASCTYKYLGLTFTKTYTITVERVSSTGYVRLVAVAAGGDQNNRIYTSSQGSFNFTSIGSPHTVTGTSFVPSFTWYGQQDDTCKTTTRTAT
jgi:hypothetical protein